MEDRWQLLTLVFKRLDAKSLQVTACVCREWLEAAMNEELWRNLCLSKWPSLDQETGLDAVKAAGNYHRFYSLRSQAQLCLTNSRKLKPPNPQLQLDDLIFFVDITHKESSVCSLSQGGESLCSIFSSGQYCVFSFRVSLAESSNKSINKYCPREIISSHSCLMSATGIACSQKWSKAEMKELNVSWAVMLKGSPKILQVLDSQGSGQVLGSICNFADRLPRHFCCTSAGSSEDIAEVDMFFQQSHSILDHQEPEIASLQCSTRRLVGAAEEMNNSKCFELNELRLSILDTSSWRYFTLSQALHYLQHAFFQCTLPRGLKLLHE